MDNVDDSWTDLYRIGLGAGHLVYISGIAWIVWMIAGLTYTRTGAGHLVYLVAWIVWMSDLYQDRGRPLGLSGSMDSVDDSWTDLYQDRGRPLGLSGSMDSVDDSWTDLYQDRGRPLGLSRSMDSVGDSWTDV